MTQFRFSRKRHCNNGNVPDVADRGEEESAVGNDEVVGDGVVVFNAPLLDGDPRLARL